MALNDPPTNEELNDELNSEAEEVITNGDSNIIEDIAENVNGEYFGNQEYLLAKAIMEDYEKKRAPLYWDSLEGSEQNNDKYILYDAIENCTEKLNEKADQSTVTDLSNTVSSLSTTVETKADQSTVTSLSNTVSNLSTTVGTKAVKKTWSVSVPNTGWSSSAPYTKTITVSGILSSDNPHADVSFTSNSTIEIESNYFACVGRITTANNSITLVCPKEIPGGTFTLKLEAVR